MKRFFLNPMPMLYSYLLFLLFAACKEAPIQPGSIPERNDPNFKIVANDDGVLKKFTRKVEVFGIKIFAVPAVTDDKLLHAANIMAQYLDNDEDGNPDNPAVLDKMLKQKAFIVLWKKESDLNTRIPKGWEGQDLGNDETHPEFVSGGKTGTFDASLEEVLHIITHAGYAEVYPDIFGEKPGSKLADAMDLARGGQFMQVPRSYPDGVWYSYDDKTCDYACMVTEYHYWALTSLLGAQENRLSNIQHEWKANTPAKLEQMDPAVYQLLTDPQYKFPRILPDGTYRR